MHVTSLQKRRDAMSPPFFALVLGAFFLIGLTGCAHKVGVRPVDFEKRYEVMSRSTLDSGSPSERTMLFLRQRDLIDGWERDPIPTLTALDRTLHKAPDRETLFVLMELCYREARRAPKLSEVAMKLERSCALYAYNYLFDPKLGPPRVPTIPTPGWHVTSVTARWRRR